MEDSLTAPSEDGGYKLSVGDLVRMFEDSEEATQTSRKEAERNHELLTRALDDLKTLRTLLYSDPGSEPPPPHY